MSYFEALIVAVPFLLASPAFADPPAPFPTEGQCPVNQSLVCSVHGCICACADGSAPKPGDASTACPLPPAPAIETPPRVSSPSVKVTPPRSVRRVPLATAPPRIPPPEVKPDPLPDPVDPAKAMSQPAAPETDAVASPMIRGGLATSTAQSLPQRSKIILTPPDNGATNGPAPTPAITDVIINTDAPDVATKPATLLMDVLSHWGNAPMYFAPPFVRQIELTGSAPFNVSANGWLNVLKGNAADNLLSGEHSDDFLGGGGGRDALLGGDGADQLGGEAGDDLLFGGAGQDLLTGGPGRDVFLFAPSLTNSPETPERDSVPSAPDTVFDFSNGDQVWLMLPGGKFIGNAPSATSGTVRFNNGALEGDVDGDGSADFAIKFPGSNASLFSAENVLFLS